MIYHKRGVHKYSQSFPLYPLIKDWKKNVHPPINHNKYNTRFDRVVLFIIQYRTTIKEYFGHPVYFLSQLFKKPVNAVWDKRGTRTDGEVWSVVVSLQCRNIASRTRQSTSSGLCVCVSFRIPQHDVTPAPAKAYLHTDLTSYSTPSTRPRPQHH